VFGGGGSISRKDRAPSLPFPLLNFDVLPLPLLPCRLFPRTTFFSRGRPWRPDKEPSRRWPPRNPLLSSGRGLLRCYFFPSIPFFFRGSFRAELDGVGVEFCRSGVTAPFLAPCSFLAPLSVQIFSLVSSLNLQQSLEGSMDSPVVEIPLRFLTPPRRVFPKTKSEGA